MSTTAKSTKTLRLTSRAKSPKNAAPRRAMMKAAAETIAQELTAERTCPAAAPVIAEIIAQAPVTPGLDGDAGTPAEQIGEVVKPAKAKKTGKKPEAKVDHSTTLFALLDRPERVTPREMMDATGLSHTALKAAVGKLLREKNLKVVLQRNPSLDPADRRLTSFLYTIEKKA